MKQRSSGSRLGTIAGLILIFSFFLPWVRACDQDINGYTLATSNGYLENPWLIWMTVVVGLFCVLLFFISRSDTAQTRTRAGVARLIAALIGLWSLLDAWSLLRRAGGGVGDLLFGGWLLVMGYIGLLASAVMDFATSGAEVALPAAAALSPPPSPPAPPPQVDYALPGAPPSQVDHSLPGALPARQPAFCSNCGQSVKPDARFCMSCGHALQPLASQSQAASPVRAPRINVNKRVGSLLFNVEIVRSPANDVNNGEWLVAKKDLDVDTKAPFIECQCPWCGQVYTVVAQPAHLEFCCLACGQGIWVDVNW